MSTSRTLSDDEQKVVLRFVRVRRERQRYALTRTVLESSVALSKIITEAILARENLSDELQELLSVVLARQAAAHGRLAGRTHPEAWLDVVAAHALERVTEEVLT
jgi:hypothetical protein